MGMGDFHLLKWKGMLLPLQRRKMIVRGKRSSFSPRKNYDGEKSVLVHTNNPRI